jgi:hypothetical protein
MNTIFFEYGLLAGENAEQAYQCDRWRRWRANVEEAIDHPDQNAGTYDLFALR